MLPLHKAVILALDVLTILRHDSCESGYGSAYEIKADSLSLQNNYQYFKY